MLSNEPIIDSPNNVWPKSRKLLFLICLIGFVYQSYKNMFQYLNYEIVIETKPVKPKEILDLPAITLCTDKYVTYLKTPLRQKFKRINDSLALIDRSNDSDIIKEKKRESAYSNYVFGHDIRHFFHQSIHESDFSECYLNRPTIWMNKKNWNLRFNRCPLFSRVLESKVESLGKCFTYFSRQHSHIKGVSDLQIDRNQIDDQSVLIGLIVSMNKFEDSFRTELMQLFQRSKKNVFMFIHDSNRMPSFDRNDAIELSPGMDYDIRFWSTKKKLLKHPFETNCFDYSRDSMSRDKPKSSDQCVRNCYLEKINQNLKCLVDHNTPPLVNDDNLNKYNLRPCHFDYTGMWFKKQCVDYCRTDCRQTEYHFDYTKSELNIQSFEFNSKVYEKFSLVHIRYKSDEEYEHKYKPIHTMCSSIQQIFIYLIIWFGISIFSLCSVFEMAVVRAKPHMLYISKFDDKVSPNTPPLTHLTIGEAERSPQPMIKPKFKPMMNSPTIGSNVKLEHYNEFISKVVEGYPNPPTVDFSTKKC